MFNPQEAEKQCKAIGDVGTVPGPALLKFAAYARLYFPAALEALEEARVFRAELVELVDGDDSTLADQIRDLMLNLDEGILKGESE